MTLLGSHDTARWASIAGSSERQLAGLGFLMAYPGVPTVYYGDEVGLAGADSDRGRAPMPWDAGRWDTELLDGYRHLVGVRRRSAALQRGGLRWLHTGDDHLVFARESNDETVLVHLSRGHHGDAPDRLDLHEHALATGDARPTVTTLAGDDLLVADDGRVTLPDGGPAVHIWRIES